MINAAFGRILFGLVVFSLCCVANATQSDGTKAGELQACEAYCQGGPLTQSCLDIPDSPPQHGYKDSGQYTCNVTDGPRPGYYGSFIYADVAAPCNAGDKYSKNFPGNLSNGDQKCVTDPSGASCLWTFSGGPADGGDGPPKHTCLGDICTTTGTFTNSGQSCTAPKPPPEICAGDGSDSSKCTGLPPTTPPKYCDENSGICVTADTGPAPHSPPQICAGDNCIAVPPEGGHGACAAGNQSALCAGPGAPNPGPQAPPPPIPPPPIDPYSNQPPPIIVITTPSSNGDGSQQNNVQHSSCGGSNQPPCKTSTSGNGNGSGGISCGGTGQAACPPPPAPGVKCNDGTTTPDGWCPAECPNGGHLIFSAFGLLCSNGATPHCGDSSTPNSDGNCPPPKCGAGYVLAVDGTCQPQQCAKGSTLGADNMCHPTPQCTAPAVMGNDGQCYLPSTCPSGSTKQADGTCKPDSGGGSTPPTCPTGYTYNGTACVGPPPTGGGGGGSGGATGGSGNPQTGCTAGAVCNDSAQGGYDCSSAPSCSGDPVLCNMDFQDWKANCPGDHLPGQDDMDNAIASLKTDPSSVSKDDTDVDLTSSLDASGFLPGSGSCPAFDPFNFSFGGQSVSVDLNSSASWCLLIQAIGALLLAFAYFRAFQILMRG